ncbi:protein DBF4 homolog A [Brachyistius frenatus]|uniref:protein DBF4 homolog A n=1 Tax=Brachyistius frenatus TaxID=100188 RepID=UPI0037E7ACD6
MLTRDRRARKTLFSMNENTMKPKQRHAGPDCEGNGGNTVDKTSLTQAKQTSQVPSPGLVKPFAGKVIYLDLPSNRATETLESDIKELGGTVEKFFSKEIRYLVSNKREARYVHCLRQDSPVPSPDSGQSSPQPRSNSHRPVSRWDNLKNRPQAQTDTFVTSRGKSLVERVVKEQERLQINKILSNALEWGVKILYIDDVLAYVQKKKKIISSQVPVTTAVKTRVKAESAAKQGFHKGKGGRISKPFIKVEDSSKHYRPICLTMPNMPEFNLRTVAPCSPFFVEEKDPPGNRQRGQRGVKASASEEKAHNRKKNRDKKRGGYCECCVMKYDNLTAHLRSERHKAFSKSDKYLVLDRLVSAMHCNFMHIKTKVKRSKCSVSSVVVVPGPCGKTDLRHKGDLDPSDTVKEEEHRTVDGCEGLDSGYNKEIRSAPGSASPTRRERDWRNSNTYLDKSKHKSLARKWACRQNSLTSGVHKAEQSQLPECKLETAPSRGEYLPSFPSRVSQVDLVEQIPHKDVKSSTSHSHNMNIQNTSSSKHFNATANEQEVSDINKDTLLFEAIRDGNVLPERARRKRLSETEEVIPLAQGFSPVRKIQRRIRIYKHKRRKVDLNVERLKPRDVSEKPVLTLWQLFQSSDNMDVEFHGFED